MFIEEASRYDVHISVLDPQKNAPCSELAPSFSVGDFNDYETVMQWAADKDIITIEIEHVNLEALFALEKMGKKSFSSATCFGHDKRQRLAEVVLSRARNSYGPFCFG